MNYYEVPLSPTPQRFSITLAEVQYSCLLYWNIYTSTWCLDIADAEQRPLVTAIPLVTGVDLLGQFQHLGFGGHLVVQIDGTPYGLPTYANLGQQARLIFATE